MGESGYNYFDILQGYLILDKCGGKFKDTDRALGNLVYYRD